MSQGFAPSASNQMMSANVLGRNGIQASPPYAQVPQINPYAAPQGMMPTGLASLPGAGQYGKGIV